MTTNPQEHTMMKIRIAGHIVCKPAGPDTFEVLNPILYASQDHARYAALRKQTQGETGIVPMPISTVLLDALEAEYGAFRRQT